ncbi:hypothetical protein THAR02_00702 [Trichoderma harzianum]|uniref:Uncharacterized protein n=1 Tax=Trichoderma harzianum TaxID=5544 RepID=A0A0F9XR97_TRIHA|nr:hypothetical protein THAR02_00702 [Trichoderma harzianum]
MRFRLRRIHLKIDRLNPDESFTFMDEMPDINIRLSFVHNLRISDSQTDKEDPEQNEIGREEIEDESFFAKPSPLCPSRLRSPLYESNEQPQGPEEVLRMKIKYQETWVGIAKFIGRLRYQCACSQHCATIAQMPDYMFIPSAFEVSISEGTNITTSRQKSSTVELAHAIQLHRQSGKPKWKGFFINEDRTCDTVHGKGSLHTLYLVGSSERRIHLWSDYTDFNKLTKLHLGITTIDAVQALAIIGEGGGLSSLSSLALMPQTWHLEQAMAADASVCRLLRAIKPLQSLELEDEVGDSAWRAVIDQHGNSLRELRFVPASMHFDDIEALVLSCGRIRLLSGICLNLEKLELRIPRTHGDRDEVGIYQILGQLPRLKKISLILDCSIVDPPEVRHGESFIEMGGWELPVDAFRAALINNAMDSALAQSIFETIATTRAYTGGNSLVNLKLKIYGAGNFGRFSIDNEPKVPLEWVGQSWFVRRNSRDGSLVVQKIKSFVDDLDVLKDDFFERDDLRAVWMDIWPGNPGDRRNQWHSFPLARSAD